MLITYNFQTVDKSYRLVYLTLDSKINLQKRCLLPNFVDEVPEVEEVPKTQEGATKVLHLKIHINRKKQQETRKFWFMNGLLLYFFFMVNCTAFKFKTGWGLSVPTRPNIYPLKMILEQENWISWKPGVFYSQNIK